LKPPPLQEPQSRRALLLRVIGGVLRKSKPLLCGNLSGGRISPKKYLEGSVWLAHPKRLPRCWRPLHKRVHGFVKVKDL
jgi:hypothetical protein